LNKIASGIMLILLLVSWLGLVFNIQPAKAWAGTVTIRGDGSIDPQGAPMKTYDNVTYTLTDNITSSAHGIVVERDNIIVDGSGYTLQGTGISGSGLEVSGVSNVTIKNMEIKLFYYGVSLDYSSGNIVSGSNITNNEYGIHLSYSSNNSISGNHITTNNREGIGLYTSSNNSISGNNITNNECGVYMTDSASNNTVSGNNITNNNYEGIGLYSSSTNNTVSENMFTNNGLFVWYSFQNVVEDNLVNGKLLVYLENASGCVVSDAGQVVLVNCDNIVVDSLDLSNTTYGAELWQTSNTKITNNHITNNWMGIYLEYSSYNTVSRNNIANNWGLGINLFSSCNYNIVSGNNITNNDYGIGVVSSSYYNTVSGNNIINNWEVGVTSDSGNSISGNNIANNWIGISLWGGGNTIFGNNITNNECGIQLNHANSNRFFHNNFNDNAQQVSSSALTNVWDDGYPSGGNYWSDYGGTDSDGDGFGDSPYVIDVDNQDNFPLMCPYIAGDCDHNGIVNIADASLIGWYWQQTVPPAPKNADINNDGTINAADAQTIIDNWLKHA
jgi:parallel beta-helix repeat protein